jgi:hypothetical protein
LVLVKIGIIDKDWNELIFPVGIGILDKDWYSLTEVVFLMRISIPDSLKK